MIKSYQVLTEYPRERLSPVNLSEFARRIEDAYADDLYHQRMDWRAREDVISCVIERFRSCDGWPGAKSPLALWEHRRQRLHIEAMG